jgi:hypothetical protein
MDRSDIYTRARRALGILLLGNRSLRVSTLLEEALLKIELAEHFENEEQNVYD